MLLLLLRKYGTATEFPLSSVKFNVRAKRMST